MARPIEENLQVSRDRLKGPKALLRRPYWALSTPKAPHTFVPAPEPFWSNLSSWSEQVPKNYTDILYMYILNLVCLRPCSQMLHVTW